MLNDYAEFERYFGSKAEPLPTFQPDAQDEKTHLYGVSLSSLFNLAAWTDGLQNAQGQKFNVLGGFPILPRDEDVVSVNNTTTGFPHRELPQGGVHSSFLLSCLIDGYFAGIGKGVAKIAYADNLAMGAHSDKEALDALKSLQQAVTTKFGGGITLHEKEVRDGSSHGGSGFHKNEIYFGNAVNFVGYRISVDQQTTKPRMRPSQNSFLKLYRRIASEHNFWIACNGDDFEKEALKFFEHWAKMFSAWKPNEYSRELFLINLLAYRQDAIS